MSVDEELGLVYVATGMTALAGSRRLGDNLFGQTLIALDIESGERRWHFQFVHHDIFGYDLTAAPLLFDITLYGGQRRVVAQITPQGFVFVIHRATGEPVWPIEERRVTFDPHLTP